MLWGIRCNITFVDSMLTKGKDVGYVLVLPALQVHSKWLFYKLVISLDIGEVIFIKEGRAIPTY